MQLRGRDFRFNQLSPTLLQRLDDLLRRVMGGGKMPLCPVCKSATMRRHDWRGCVCEGCGTRIW